MQGSQNNGNLVFYKINLLVLKSSKEIEAVYIDKNIEVGGG